MDQQKSHSKTVHESCQTRGKGRGFSLPRINSTLPMPHVNPSKKEETLQKSDYTREKLDKDEGKNDETYSELQGYDVDIKSRRCPNMFGKKRKDESMRPISSSKDFFAERNNNPYMIAAFEEISRVGDAQSLSELKNAGARLNQSISSALAARIPRECLTAILQELANQTAICQLFDEGDTLLQQRISILSDAFSYLDQSY